MRLSLAFLLLAVSRWAFAYPEMIRHGYTSCTACHVSPSGGGVTTPYGRSLSKEILSRWSYEGEEQQLHGFIESESLRSWVDGTRETGFNVSGNFRYIQTRVETQSFESGRSFPMQRDLEVVSKWHYLSLVSNLGVVYYPNDRDKVEVRRLYALYNLSDELSVRAGRFTPTFGIMTNDHYLSIKQRLLFGQLTERDTAEFNYTSEKWSAFLNFSKAPDSKQNLNQEKSVSAGLNYNIMETARLGFNYWYGDALQNKRDVTGINALVGFSKKFYSLTEFDLQTSQPDIGSKSKGHYYYQRFGYEWFRGFHVITQVDGSKTNLDNSRTHFYSFGGGITFYPRPHWELQFLWSRPKFKGQDFADSAFVVMHYYL